MSTFVITQRVVYYELYYVDADAPEDALEKFQNVEYDDEPFYTEAQYVEDCWVSRKLED